MPSLASKLASLAPAPLRDAASSAATHAAATAVAATDSEWMPDAVSLFFDAAALVDDGQLLPQSPSPVSLSTSFLPHLSRLFNHRS